MKRNKHMQMRIICVQFVDWLFSYILCLIVSADLKIFRALLLGIHPVKRIFLKTIFAAHFFAVKY